MEEEYSRLEWVIRKRKKYPNVVTDKPIVSFARPKRIKSEKVENLWQIFCKQKIKRKIPWQEREEQEKVFLTPTGLTEIKENTTFTQ